MMDEIQGQPRRPTSTTQGDQRMPTPRFPTCATIALVLCLTATGVRGDDKLKGIACRSVHLGYPAAEGTAFYNEITIRKSAVGTYFMVCGWDKGYFGLQELGNGKKLLLFSVWDSNQNNPNGVKKELRTKLLHKDKQVRVGRFGGEGTGGQSFFDYNWKTGQTYRLMVTSRIDQNRSEYSGWFFVPEEKAWKHLVTFSTVTGGRNLRGYYSFIEDFKRNRVSATKVRQADFGGGWVKTKTDKWTPLLRARFTADSNPVTNIDAGLNSDRFFLTTGGETSNRSTNLRDFIARPVATEEQPPRDLPEL
jgi:hypothetical protein